MAVVVGDERGESPVVGGVLEDVHDGHGGVGEAVDEDGLEEALRVVGDPAYGTEPATSETSILICISFPYPGSSRMLTFRCTENDEA